MNKRAVLAALLAALCMVFGWGLAQPQTLLELEGGRAIAYEPYRLYMEVAEEISRYSTRQGVVFTLAMTSYLEANHVLLAEDECLALCAEEMNEHMQSEAYALCADILAKRYGLSEAEIARCVFENYWSQYVARALSGFYRAQEKMTGTPAEKMFNDFTEDFYANLSFEEGSVAVFAGEAIAWTPTYENLCAYNAVNALLEVADTVALNASVEDFLSEQGIDVDLTGMEDSVREAVSAMRANALYSAVFDSILEEKGKTMDDFLAAMEPFVLAQFQRAAFGQACYDAYQEAYGEAEEKPALEAYYYERLEAVAKPYVIRDLGW